MIEEVNEKDICECVNVIRVSFATVADEFGFTAENAPKFTAFATTEERLKWHLFGEHRRMYAFWDNGKIVGYYSLLLQSNNECELNNLCVLPTYRHRRIGQELLFHAFNTAKKTNCVKINIGIVEENKKLKNWYEQFGFTHTGIKKYDFFPFTCGYMEKIATVYKGNIIKNLIMDCQSYTKYRPNETTGGIFVSWRRKEELPTGA